MRYLLCFILVLVLPFPVFAASGHVACDYDLLTETWCWEIELYQDIISWFRIGTMLRTYADSYGYKLFVPSWIPSMQGYEVWAETRAGDFTLRLTDWCDHWLAQSGVEFDRDRWGLRFRVQYNF